MFIPKNIMLRDIQDIHLNKMVTCFCTMVSDGLWVVWAACSLYCKQKNGATRPALTQIRTSPFTLDCSIVTSSWVDCRNFCTKLHTGKYLCLADISLSLRPCICHQCRQSACEIVSCTLPAVRWWVHRRFVIVLRGLQNRTCLFMRETSSSPNQFFLPK